MDNPPMFFWLNTVVLWRVVIQALLLVGAISAHARSSVEPDLAFWQDIQGTANLQAASIAPFAAFDGTLTLGYVPHPIWIRMTVPARPAPDGLVLRVRPSFLDEIELFDPLDASRGQPSRRSGRTVPIGAEDYLSLASGFLIQTAPVDRFVYLRIKSDTSMIVHPEIISTRAAAIEGRRYEFVFGFYLALLFFMAAWAGIQYLIQQQVQFLLFSIRQLYSLFYNFIFVGFGRLYFGDVVDVSTLNFFYAFFILTIALPVGIFEMNLLSEMGTSRRLRILVYILLSMVGVNLILWGLGHLQVALKFNQILILTATLLTAWIGWSAKIDADIDAENRYAIRGVLKVYYLLFTVSLVVPVIGILDIYGSPYWSVQLLVLSGLLSGVMFMALLALRGRAKERQRLQALINNRVIAEQLIREQEKRREKEGFLAMLAHELKNPLAAVSMLVDTSNQSGRAIKRAVGDMDGVIERCIQVGRIEDGRYTLCMEQLNIRKLIDQLCAAQEPEIRDRLSITADGSSRVLADVRLYSLAVKNLIDNAIKYSISGSEIKISCLQKACEDVDGVLLRISNQTTVATRPDPVRIFQKYYRSPEAQRQIGAGLGLYLTAAVVKLMGGVVFHGSEADADDEISFSIWLPLREQRPSG